MHLRGVLYVLALASSKVVDVANYEELLPSIKDDTRHTLVFFFAPWCRHSKRALPIFDEAAAVIDDDSLTFAKIDGSAADVMKNLEIVEYPDIAIYKNSTGAKFSGDISVDNILKFVHAAGPRVFHFDRLDDMETWWAKRVQYSGAKNTLVIFHGLDLPEKLNLGCPTRITSYVSFRDSPSNSVEIRHGSDPADVATLSDSAAEDEASLDNFASRHRLPLFQEITPETFREYESNTVVLAGGIGAINVPTGFPQPSFEDVRDAALVALDSNLRLVWLNMTKNTFNGCPTQTEENDTPGYSACFHFFAGPRKGKYWTTVTSWPLFYDWVQDITSDKVHSSQESVEESGLHRVSANSLARILDEEHPALLLVAHGEEDCVAMLRTLAERARQADKNDVIIGVLDTTTNDSPEQVPSHLRWKRDVPAKPMLLAKPSGSSPVRKMVSSCSESAVIQELIAIDSSFSVLVSKTVEVFVLEDHPYKDLRDWVDGKEDDIERIKGRVAELLDDYDEPRGATDANSPLGQLDGFMRLTQRLLRPTMETEDL